MVGKDYYLCCERQTMKQSITDKYEKTFKQFVLSVLLLIFISVILLGLFSSVQYPIKYIILVIAFLNVISIIVVYTIPVGYTKQLIKFYFILLIVILFPTTVFSLSKGIVTAVFWYFPIPVYIYTVYLHTKAIKWSLFCLGLMLIAFVMAYFVRLEFYNYEMTLVLSKELLLANFINAGAAMVMIYLCMYHMHKFSELRAKKMLDSISDEHTELKDMHDLFDKENDDEFKYAQIYNQIEKYFDEKQPYLDPDFKMVQMAYELDINIVYLAKAIRMKRDMNFSNFVNFYRIERVKELMLDNSKKYTLKYIHLSSGFKNQSSFNKAFKLVEGITPSEYYKLNRVE